ncbi:hypothetical protein JCM11641_002351 [Rhodosporidiobolus odoratus]
MHSAALLRSSLPRATRPLLSSLPPRLPSSTSSILVKAASQASYTAATPWLASPWSLGSPSGISLLQRRPYTTPTASPKPSSSFPSPEPDPTEDNPKAPLSLRIKTLFRRHGWTALVIYLLLSALDFGLTFLLIYAVGADRVREAEDWVLEGLGWRRASEEKGRIRAAVERWRAKHGNPPPPSSSTPIQNEAGVSQAEMVGGGQAADPIESTAVSTEVKKREEVKNAGDKGYSALATTAVLAYAIHKTALLPFRVGVTVAITPKVVRMLQGWGWKVGMAGTPAGAAAGAVAASKEASS